MMSGEQYKFRGIVGITLISLVITIILLIILAGIAINLSLGNNGLFNKAKLAQNRYNEQLAREKLEILLLDLQTEKINNENFNKFDDVDFTITANNMIANGNIVNDILKFHTTCVDWGVSGQYIASCQIDKIWLEK